MPRRTGFEVSQTGTGRRDAGLRAGRRRSGRGRSEPAPLRRETLTETFAHLPIGLAVFDKNRRLGLFNPAADRPREDRRRLARRPALAARLPERLRETRQMEQKGFLLLAPQARRAGGRRADGTYEENRVLPSGKIFPRDRPPLPAGRARLPVRGHLDLDHPRSASTVRSSSSARRRSTGWSRRSRCSTRRGCSFRQFRL